MLLRVSALAFAVALGCHVAAAAEPPTFTVDAAWPKPLPNDWILGQIGGMAVDAQDHIWVIQRPNSLTDDEDGAALEPPRSLCCKAAPPVLEFDAAGNLLAAWGGPGHGYDWPGREHGITVDDGYVWVTGNADTDNFILKLKTDGSFVMQIGKKGPSGGSLDHGQLGKPAETFVDRAARELYVADGYGNHRVIVFDTETGAFKRQWGAYGHAPSDEKQGAYDPVAPVDQQFQNPVHCVKIARDGLVYVCDRVNNRVQIFHKDGSFVGEWFYEKATRGNGAVWDLAFWPDAAQTYLLNADGENNAVRLLRRSDGAVVGRFGRNGRNAGQFHWVHAMAVDSKGNIYTGEVDTGKRIQKFVPSVAP